MSLRIWLGPIDLHNLTYRDQREDELVAVSSTSVKREAFIGRRPEFVYVATRNTTNRGDVTTADNDSGHFLSTSREIWRRQQSADP